MVILPVEATLPRDEPEETGTPEQSPSEENPQQRISREESVPGHQEWRTVNARLYGDGGAVHHRGGLGSKLNSVPVIVGAMVISPLLYPNVASVARYYNGLPGELRHGPVTALAGFDGVAIVRGYRRWPYIRDDPVLPEIVDRARGRGWTIFLSRLFPAGGRVRVHDRRVGDTDRGMVRWPCFRR